MMISVNEFYEEISRNIKKYRKQRNITQAQLAEKAELSSEFIRRIESKKCKKNFSIETVYLISLALSIPPEKLFVISKERGSIMDSKLTFLENHNAEFEDFISRVSVDLEKTHEEYMKISMENSDILNKYPKLRDVIEEKKGHTLTEQECNMLAKYIDNSVDLTFFDYREIFFKGYKEAYYHFLQSNLLEENRGNTN